MPLNRSADDLAGIAWWERLSDDQQTAWLENVASPAAAWALYKLLRTSTEAATCPPPADP